MGQPPAERKTYTIEEWLELDQTEGVRYEYHLGEVFAMARDGNEVTLPQR